MKVNNSTVIHAGIRAVRQELEQALNMIQERKQKINTVVEKNNSSPYGELIKKKREVHHEPHKIKTASGADISRTNYS